MEKNQENDELKLEKIDERSRIKLRHVKEILIYAILLAVLAGVIESVLALPHLMRVMDGAAATTEASAKTVDALGSQVADFKTQTAQMGKVMASAATAITQTSVKVNESLDHLNSAIDGLVSLERGLDQNLNRGTLPALTASLTQLKTTIGSVNDGVVKLSVVETNAALTVKTINDQTLPLMNAELVEIKKTTVQATGMLANGNQAVGHVNHVAAYFDDQLTKPKKFAKKVGGFFLGLSEHVIAYLAALKIAGQ